MAVGYIFGPPDPTAQDFYEGIFTRIQRTYPIDTYWIWTPEEWEWGQMTSNSSDFTDAVADLEMALAAHDAVNATWDMATCGWVLGPLPDRTIFDKVLNPRFAAITSIDMDVGNTPVDPAYADVTRHSKWAIPWVRESLFVCLCVRVSVWQRVADGCVSSHNHNLRTDGGRPGSERTRTVG